MKKKITCLILGLVVFMSLLSGCIQSPAETTASEGTDATFLTEKPGVDGMPKVINGVYATCGNYNYVISSTATVEINFYLLCEKPLPDDATITIDTDASYQVRFLNQTPKNVGFGYNPELWYMTERKVDMVKYYQLYIAYLDAQEAYSTGKITQEEYTSTIAPWNEFNQTHIMPAMTAYSEYRNTACPFYFYKVMLLVKHSKNEVLTHVQLKAGDMSREIPLGRIELRYEEAPKSIGTSAEFVNFTQTDTVFPNHTELYQQLLKTGGISGAINDPWCPYGQYFKFSFVAKEDITLTDVRFLDDGVNSLQFTSMEYVIAGKTGPVQLTWKPGSAPVMIRKGEAVMALVYYDSLAFREAECHVRGNLVLEYTDSQGTGRLCTEVNDLRKRPCMEMYQWAFQNIDTKAFYLDAYYTYYYAKILSRTTTS